MSTLIAVPFWTLFGIGNIYAMIETTRRVGWLYLHRTKVYGRTTGGGIMVGLAASLFWPVVLPLSVFCSKENNSFLKAPKNIRQTERIQRLETQIAELERSTR